MASLFMGICKVFVFLTFFSSLHSLTALSVEFEVGGNKGWIIPPSKNVQLYNDWASNNRFKIDDTLHFEYKKDSVMVVTQEEYEKCKSSHPIFFSNNGDTVYRLDRPGLFYFISGVAGHCERGLKMIVKVLEPETPPQSANDTAATAPSSGGVEVAAAASSPTVIMLIMSFFGALLM
ncbi:unnamed protein product [Ilex paraguariensis]|uniref:Phytocyanin domain-containing protein n=1 Tax=Ilex paraguariensis TaxID=185542 RepID=A0ABC8RS85_9AQUA